MTEKKAQIALCGDSIMYGNGEHFVIRYKDNKPAYFAVNGEEVTEAEFMIAKLQAEAHDR